MSSIDLTESMPSDDRRSASRGADLTVALLLVLVGLFVFFWRQPAAIADAMRLALPDGDDAMRLLSVRSLLAGQDWFDMTQLRYLPPAGVVMHWSRLVDAPLAGGVLALTPFVGRELAERLVVTAWPLLLFVVYAGVLFWGTRRLFRTSIGGGLAVLVASQMIVFGDIFAPGRIDHHNVQIILVAAAAIASGLAQRSARAAIASGILCALSLAVGLETLPVVACIGVAFALTWIVQADRAAPAFAYYGASLALAALAIFAAQTAPSLWLAPACDTISPPWLLLTTGGGLAAFGLAVAMPSTSPRWQRLVAATLAGAVLVAAFSAIFPACLNGPYQIVPQPFRDLWVHDILEAYSFRRFLEANPNAAIQAVGPLLVAALATSFVGWRDKTDNRAMLLLLAGLLWLGVLLAQYQIRTVYITSAFLPLAAGWFLDRCFVTLHARVSILARLGSLACGMLMFGLVWAAGLHFFGGTTGQARASTANACLDPRSIAPLAALPTGLVLNQVALGPHVLLHTPHSIVVAGYHRGTAGIIAGLESFTGSEADMRRNVDRFHIDYVVICPSELPPNNVEPEPFARELAQGRSVAWLEPLDLDAGPLKVWRVVR